jgi:hypothetical protein
MCFQIEFRCPLSILGVMSYDRDHDSDSVAAFPGASPELR